jgi:diacylglycerol kinase
MKPDKFSLKSRVGSFKYAFNGLRSLLKYEQNSRIQVFAALTAIIFGIFLKLNHYEWCLLLIVTGLVFLTELLNSSLESLSDIVDPELNERIRRAKDYSAAAVLISAVIAVIVGALILIPKLLELFRN